MYLEMRIGNILIDYLPIEFNGLRSTMERQDHLNDLVDRLKIRHHGILSNVAEPPMFYVDHVPSRMNRWYKKPVPPEYVTMPKAPNNRPLSIKEQETIIELYESSTPVKHIAELIGRSKKPVYKYINRHLKDKKKRA